MNTAAIKKTEIVRDLSLIPEHKLDSVHMYIDAMLTESKRLAKNNRSLKGIWSNRGFEEIIDLEGEIKEMSKHISDATLGRQF